MALFENDRFGPAMLFDEDRHSHALHDLNEGVLGSRRI
jgi:hypothetical protein